jgi:tRNA A-37 threonylcarbamoyl transferase component Bud32
MEHQDLAERNVLLNEVDDPVVIDFDMSSYNHSCPPEGCLEIKEMHAMLCLTSV